MDVPIDDLRDVESDLVSLARLAARDGQDDIRLFLARLVQRYRQRRPALASTIEQALKNSATRSATGILRRTAGHEITAPLLDEEDSPAFLQDIDDRTVLQPPLLSSLVERQVTALVTERRECETLKLKGIDPTRSAILVGPPGVGKTLSARWIASQLGTSLKVLDLASVMSSQLGRTGRNLRVALDSAKKDGSVLLIDEIDAIAKRRSDDSDVGELKRLVTVLLQEMDRWPASSLLLAATNHPELLDPALWRRFEVVIQFESSGLDTIEHGIRRFLATDLPTFEPWIGMLCAAFNGHSLADVERSIASLRRRTALDSAPLASSISQFLEESAPGMSKASRLALAVELARTGQLSHQRISSMTGVSRDTIRKHAGPSPRRGRGMK